MVIVIKVGNLIKILDYVMFVGGLVEGNVVLSWISYCSWLYIVGYKKGFKNKLV